MMELRPQEIESIRRQAIAFQQKHPEARPKHIVEAFEAAWFDDESLTFEQVCAASAVVAEALGA